MLSLNFHPFPELAGSRLLLRQIAEADAEQLFKLRTDTDVMEYLDRAPLQSIDEAAEMIKTIRAAITSNEAITWAIALQSAPHNMIGTVGYWKITKEHYRAELGYMLLPAYFKKGIMTEAINMANHFAFNEMKLHSIEANIDPLNAASAAVLIKTGFKQEAHFKENFYFDGVFKDSAIYSLLTPNKNKRQ